jgi:VWFA-related protein
MLMVAAAAPAQQRGLEYEVNVRAMIIPLFAVDAKGSPVYDLKEGDIQLLVDGKPVDIAQFTAFTLREQERVKAAAAPAARKLPVPGEEVEAMGRISFIILDSVANDKKGIGRARKIAVGIINNSPGKDAFVILESNPGSGLKYIMGPETDKKKLTAVIKKIKMFAGSAYSSKRRKPLGIDASGARSVKEPQEPVNSGKSVESSDRMRDYRRHMLKVKMQKAENERTDYRMMMQRFAFSLGQLKYALQTIIQPKTVFLISGGVPAYQLQYDVIRYHKFLGASARAINQGGGLLYVVNSVRPKRAGAGETLKHMADVSGGKYFAGSDTGRIVSHVKSHTTAYYELAFYPGKAVKNNLRIKVKCKRKGVEINTVNHAERGKPYKEMKTLQKKLFALSVVTGGSWSRIVGRVQKIKIKKIKKDSSPSAKTVALKLPAVLADKDVDIFTVNLDPLTMKANITLARKRAVSGKRMEINVPVEKDRTQHVVIVEPAKTFCVYNQVK